VGSGIDLPPGPTAHDRLKLKIMVLGGGRLAGSGLSARDQPFLKIGF
jgi:hypothetical protein